MINFFKKVDSLTRYSWLTSAIILIIGFFFLHYDMVEYGSTFFVLFPLSVGFAMGTIYNDELRWKSYYVLSLIIFFGFLLAGHLEGLVCVLMALPIFAIMILIGYNIQKRRQEFLKNQNKLLVSIAPLIILLLFNQIEKAFTNEPQIVLIENSILLDYSADKVFDEVKKMDKLNAEKSFGLRLGLPTPYKCTLESDSIGAKRICYFSNGKITAEITKYEKGKILQMKVIDYNLTGREWFKFIDASYTFEEAENKTKIVRVSSYKSILHPRIYWEPLEKWGIEQEHIFVLNSLKKNLEEKYGK